MRATGQNRFRLIVCDDMGSTGFATEVYAADAWKRTSLPSTPAAALIHGQPAGDGLTGNLAHGRWQTRFQPQAGGVWIETVLELTAATSLDLTMALWLGRLDDLDDRQAHTWRQTVLGAPTRNQGGLGGNDLPAGYLYDHAQQIETILYFPADEFRWAPRRFHEFSLREAMIYRPRGQYGFGLFLNAPAEPMLLEPGTHHLRWWITQRTVPDGPPSPWMAQQTLIEAIAPLLDRSPARMRETPDWSEMAEGALADLGHQACWIESGGVRGLRAYVQGSSAIGRDQQSGFELMTQLDVLHPLLVWRDATGSTAANPVIDALRDTLPHFSQPALDFVANGFPFSPTSALMDTWYFLENALIKLPWVAYLTDDAQLCALFAQALRGADRLMEQTGGLIPLFADASDWRARGPLLNAGAAGMYAAGAILAAQLLGDSAYLERGWQALQRIHQFPPAMLTHEPQQLTYGAAAAAYLGAHGYGDAARTIAGDLVRLSLRMGYWAADPAVSYYDPRGMFQACASLSYPAYKENVETLLGWPELLSDPQNHAFLPIETMAAFANLQRCHNYAFFDAWIPETRRRGPCPHIPYEDLATAEFPHTAELGKELYGAGEVFWSALLFDQTGLVDESDILCLALDVPGVTLRRTPGSSQRFLLYNPTSHPRLITFTHHNSERSVSLDAASWKVINCQV